MLYFNKNIIIYVYTYISNYRVGTDIFACKTRSIVCQKAHLP